MKDQAHPLLDFFIGLLNHFFFIPLLEIKALILLFFDRIAAKQDQSSI